MELSPETNWYALHAKTRRENFAAANIAALNLDAFLPRLKIERSVRGVLGETSRPLFPGYFFARFCPRIALDAVKCCRGVLRVVSAGRFPIPVDGATIGEIQTRVEADGLIRIRRQALQPGDRVSIDQGPLEGMMGRVERELDDRKRVAILLETLWNARVIVERHCIEAVAA